MSLLNRCSSSSCMAGSMAEEWAGARRFRAPLRRGPGDPGPGASRRRAALLARLRRLLGIELAQLDGGVREAGRQVVEPQVVGAVLVLKGDPDLGPPGLLVVAYGSLHGADDLHHFLVVHDSCPLGWGAALSRARSFRSLRAHRSSSRGSPCIRGGASPAAGETAKAEGRGPEGRPGAVSKARQKGGPARNETRSRESRHDGQRASLGRRDAIAARGGRAENDGKGWAERRACSAEKAPCPCGDSAVPDPSRAACQLFALPRHGETPAVIGCSSTSDQ